MKKLKWIVEVEVAEMWVADGFDLDDDRISDMLQEHLRFATEKEVEGRVIQKPDQKLIDKLQCKIDYDNLDVIRDYLETHKIVDMKTLIKDLKELLSIETNSLELYIEYLKDSKELVYDYDDQLYIYVN